MPIAMKMAKLWEKYANWNVVGLNPGVGKIFNSRELSVEVHLQDFLARTLYIVV